MSLPSSCLFLYSSTDKPFVRQLVDLARNDPQCAGFQSWLDIHSIDNDIVIDLNVSAQITAARAIIFCVGPDGLGPYQRAHEAPQIRQRIKDKGSPLRLIPLLLPGGLKAAVPDWMQSRSVLNWDRGERYPDGVWRLLRQRLSTPPMDGAEAEQDQPRPSTNLSAAAQSICSALSDEIRDHKTFSVLLGPYDQDLSTIGGPDRLSAEMLKIIGWSPLDGQVIPWPTEAATWAVIGKTRTKLVQYLTSTLQRPETVAPDTSRSIARFAREFQEKSAVRNKEPGNQERPWRLQILTTHLDNTLENALIQEVGAFFRIKPTASSTNWVEVWKPGPQQGSVSRHHRKVKRLQDLDLMELRKEPGLDQVDIFVIKLCGVLEDSDSLTISTADFFRTWQKLMNLPTEIKNKVQRKPLLMLGSGQSSTLGAMIRSVLLPASPEESQYRQRRFCVMAENPIDRLSRLEDHFIDGNTSHIDGNTSHIGGHDSHAEFCDLMQVKNVARALPSAFIDKLKDSL